MSARRAPSWYDLLDVADDATADEIRAAWKRRDRRPRPDRPPLRACSTRPPRCCSTPTGARRTTPSSAAAAPEPEPAPSPSPRPSRPPSGRPSRGRPSCPAGCWPASPPLTLAVLVAAARRVVRRRPVGPVGRGGDAAAAQAAAERAIVPILSYDATHLDASAGGRRAVPDRRLPQGLRRALRRACMRRQRVAATGTVVARRDLVRLGPGARPTTDRVAGASCWSTTSPAPQQGRESSRCVLQELGSTLDHGAATATTGWSPGLDT